MIFQLSSTRKIGIVWHYEHCKPSIEDRVQVITTCTIYNVTADTKEIYVKGVSALRADKKGNPVQHTKETARKVSLSYALLESDFTHEERRIIWEHYFSDRGKPVPNQTRRERRRKAKAAA